MSRVKSIDYDNFIPLTSLIAFYEENKHKIYMQTYGNHPVNYEGFKTWKAKLANLRNISRNGISEITTYMKFADVLERSIRYITFDEFMSVISRITEEMYTLIQETDTICFILGEEIYKSNLWVSLLFLGELLKKQPETFVDKVFCFGTKRIHSLTNLVKTRPGSIAIISFDDMTYTGMQIREKELFEETMRCIPPCPVNIYRSIRYYLAVPFTTTAARQKLASPYPEGINARFFENTVTLPTFKEQVLNYYKDEPATIKKLELMCDQMIESKINNTTRRNNYINIKRGHNTFKCIFRDGQSAVYFDHKIADYISVFQTLFAKGSYPSNISRKNVLAHFKSKTPIPRLYSVPLIINCDDSRTQMDCYSTFYKNIEYSYLGTPLSEKADMIKMFRMLDDAKK